MLGLARIRRTDLGAAAESGFFLSYAGLSNLTSRTRTPPSVLVFGHQKTGTSVVAAVIAQLAEVSSSIDLPIERVRPSDPTRVPASRLLGRSAPFSYRSLVKEPHWTPFAEQLMKLLPEARSVGVVRDPVRTIESICFRLSLPSDSLAGLPKVGPWWQPIIDGFCLVQPTDSALENLAHRILLCENAMADAAAFDPGRWRWVQYEEFVMDPVQNAKKIVEAFGWSSSGNADVDRQYQPGLRAVPKAARSQYQLSDVQKETVRQIVSRSRSPKTNARQDGQQTDEQTEP